MFFMIGCIYLGLLTVFGAIGTGIVMAVGLSYSPLASKNVVKFVQLLSLMHVMLLPVDTTPAIGFDVRIPLSKEFFDLLITWADVRIDIKGFLFGIIATLMPWSGIIIMKLVEEIDWLALIWCPFFILITGGFWLYWAFADHSESAILTFFMEYSWY